MGVPVLGLGAGVSVGDGVANAQQAFELVTKIKPVVGEVNYLEANYLAMSGNRKRYRPGLQDTPEISFDVYYTSSNYSRLPLLQGVTKPWVFTLPVESAKQTTISFDGSVKTWDGDFVPDQLSIITVTVKAEGDITSVTDDV